MKIVTYEMLEKTYKSSKYLEESRKVCSSWLPLEISKELVEITGSLLTDGFIDIRKSGKSLYYGYIGFFSKNVEELERFNNNIYSLFGLKGVIRRWGVRKSGESLGCIIVNSYLSRILNLCGIPGGSKTNQMYSVPTWIRITSNREMKKIFLRRSFSCEGSVYFKKNERDIKYCMYKVKELEKDLLLYLEELRGMLEEFGVKSFISKEGEYKRKDGKTVVGYRIKIKRNESILKFKNNIGFDIPKKSEKLDNLCDYITFKN